MVTNLTEKEKARYNRQILLNELAEEGQLKLKNAKVLVIGAGGLGGPVLQYLAGAGVGIIGILDPDIVSLSNLHRQVLFTPQDVGKPKAIVAKEKLSGFNPLIKIKAYPEALDENNALNLFNLYDLIIEGSDDFTTKYLANDASVLANKPLIMASIFKFEGQLSVYNYLGSATYRCLFPEPMASADMPTCSEVGVLGVLPGVLGTLMANEAIKVITGIGEVLANQFLKINLLTLETFIFEFKKDPSIQVSNLKPIQLSCKTNNEWNEIDYRTYQKEPEKYQLLDVRSTEEQQIKYMGGLNIPYSDLEYQWSQLPTDKPILVYCTRGITSQKAIELLQKKLPDLTFYNLKGGMKSV
ncbi:dinucleotide-utilizing protein [Flavobacteriaceae bacterium Ap0902]|nr:dinucleotide-utilizing protein [Flavobacteriaceae bacterium Ap0902]